MGMDTRTHKQQSVATNCHSDQREKILLGAIYLSTGFLDSLVMTKPAE